jgi:hypothetical protein
MENRSTRLAVKLDRLDFEVDRVDDFSIDSTWPRFDRLDRSTRSTTGSIDGKLGTKFEDPTQLRA